jgi:hypothetical protein
MMLDMGSPYQQHGHVETTWSDRAEHLERGDTDVSMAIFLTPPPRSGIMASDDAGLCVGFLFLSPIITQRLVTGLPRDSARGEVSQCFDTSPCFFLKIRRIFFLNWN